MRWWRWRARARSVRARVRRVAARVAAGVPRRAVRNLIMFWCVVAAGAALVAFSRLYPERWATAAKVALAAMRSAATAAGELVPRVLSWPASSEAAPVLALREGLPGPVWETGSEPPPAPDWRREARALVYAVTQVDLQSPGTLLEDGIPGLAERDGPPKPAAPPSAAGPGPAPGPPVEPGPRPGPEGLSEPRRPGGPAPAEPPRPLEPAQERRDRPEAAHLSEGCRIVIYHTHTSETYRTGTFAPDRADAYHRWNTTDTGIVAVGRVLAQRLENVYGVPVCHSAEIHDWPSHPRAYIASRATVQRLLERNPHVDIVLDVHRDAPEGLVTTVGGRRVAQLALVVGTNPQMHPGWRENLAFAREFGARIEARYPGLLRRIIERPDARLNQDLHPRSLLVEVGSFHNDLEEALAAAELLADVLAEAHAAIRGRDPVPGGAAR
ncbi:MAG: stage II sporulation protein P [Firmicutes bacterium]|nr:stage II sporulation protein P [Bacillota bacterium]